MPIYPVKSAERTMKLLELFQADRRPHTLRDVAQKQKWPAPSTLALLKTLVGMGYLIFDPKQKTYYPSLLLAGLAQWISDEFFEDSPAPEVARRLREETSEHVLITVQSDIHVLYLRVLHGAENARYGAREGGMQPMVKTASGLMLLGLMPEESIDRICRRINIAYNLREERFVPDAILRLTTTFKRQGFSTLAGSPHPEGMNLSMLLPPTRSGKRFAISVGGNTTRISERRNWLLERMSRTIATAA
jgi:DNA-binding IclR family transcriptional regulator